MIWESQKEMNKSLMGARLNDAVGQVPWAMKGSHIPDVIFHWITKH